MLGGERGIDAAGNHPGRVDPLAADQFDNLLADFPQPYAIPGNLRIGLDHSDDVPFGRIGVHAEEQIRRRQVKEAEGVRLDVFAAVEQSPEQDGGFGRMNTEDGITGLAGGERMTDRTDPADSFGYRRHLIVGPAFAEFFKTAELGHMKPGITDAAVIVEDDGDHCRVLQSGRWVLW